MALDKPIEQITETELRELVENRVSERKAVEYKQALPGKSDGERKEFLADVSSFANTAGGHFVYGIKEEEGLPVEISGFDVDNPDAVVSALDSIIRSGGPVPVRAALHTPICKFLGTAHLRLLTRPSNQAGRDGSGANTLRRIYWPPLVTTLRLFRAWE